MSETLTLDGLAVALRVLRLLAVDFGHLPAPDVQVSPVFPDVLELRFHRDLPDFEVWREALGIAPDTVDYREQNDGRTRVLKASAVYAGATLELTGFGDVRAPETVGGAA
ncbi:hypothetical protein F3K32_21445 [Streptomyces sp. LBUM 1483]|uniref:hypothetical protein n=1 Tax=Streptomyces scabiei TaxID=1930 RepID=UPI001B33D395|nr:MULTISPECIES: hypothetical protein [Streptomyces]MBP5922791.1 hypothetical protein [Streptomyces sp. LBUM 1483]MDX3200437.1 hypothetical protein [Streptomyces scabiei]MDX3222254.1 hypothetical protein [Streptomyces scabiei]